MSLVAIVGPTASGKSSLAVRIAKRINGEIICADSRTIYRGMDIGTAKPSVLDQEQVPHWGLDLVEPGKPFSVADFKNYANEKIEEISGRGRVPMLVGGTGLYVDSVLFDFKFGPKSNEEERKRLEKMTTPELQDYCVKNNIKLPENVNNKRYLIRTIERKSISVLSDIELKYDSTVVGIATSRSSLRERIDIRTEQLFKDNVVEEAMMLGKKYGWDNEAMTGNIYPIIRKYLEGQIDNNEMRLQVSTSDFQLAKRQMSWFRRNPHILWGGALSIEHNIISRFGA